MKRMYGEDLNPHTYELIDQHADHYHWDTGKAWTDSRNAAGKSDALGGGHGKVFLEIQRTAVPRQMLELAVGDRFLDAVFGEFRPVHEFGSFGSGKTHL